MSERPDRRTLLERFQKDFVESWTLDVTYRQEGPPERARVRQRLNPDRSFERPVRHHVAAGVEDSFPPSFRS